jgi:hypothetical protein
MLAWDTRGTFGLQVKTSTSDWQTVGTWEQSCESLTNVSCHGENVENKHWYIFSREELARAAGKYRQALQGHTPLIHWSLTDHYRHLAEIEAWQICLEVSQRHDPFRRPKIKKRVLYLIQTFSCLPKVLVHLVFEYYRCFDMRIGVQI